MSTGFIVNTPAGIAYFQMATLRSMIKLEKQGMRHSSGPLRPKLAAKLGLKPRDSYDKYIAAIEVQMAELQKQIAAEKQEANNGH